MAKQELIEQEAFKWLNENQLSYDIWNKKYRYNNESFSEWLKRVSNNNEAVIDLIKSKKFLFGGRTLANRGTDKQGSFSNCYSIGFVPDSLEGIMDVANKIALTFKAQGGQGLSLSKIRPKGSYIHNEFKSDGIVPFMEIFNTVTNSISQGGSRKGALMMSLDIWHKEAETFIKIKEDLDRINKANLSLEIDDKFMESVINNITDTKVVKDYSGYTCSYNINPVALFNTLCESAWKSAEPGIIFTDRFRNYNLMQHVDSYQIETCNPCGEQPLPKNGACNLCSINLSEYVVNPFTSHAHIDVESLSSDIYTIVKAMDDVLEENLNNHALLEQRELAKKYRNIGIGIMGLHDAMIKLNIVYGSSKSLDFCDYIMKIIFKNTLFRSSQLAKERGNFEGYDSRIWDSDIIECNFDKEEIAFLKKNDALRNCSLISIAPTGSLGTMFNVSTGCEPWFMMEHTRTTKSLNGSKDKSYKVLAPIAEEAKKHGISDDVLIDSKNINYKDRIKVQSVLQHYCDTAISSTINLPRETTVEDIIDLYTFAWKCGLKGVTIFRDGSREPILVSKESNSSIKVESNFNTITPIPRDSIGDVLHGETYKYKTACGTLYITVNKDNNGNIVEIFTNSSKSGTCKANLNGETRLASLALRAGVKLDEVVDSLKSIQCQSCAFAKAKGNKIDGTSCPDIIAKCIKRASKHQFGSDFDIDTIKLGSIQLESDHNEVCPECGAKLEHTGGCISCSSCGYSKCLL